jgi:NUMOD3 motif
VSVELSSTSSKQLSPRLPSMGSRKGRVFSDEHRRRISEAKKGKKRKPFSEEHLRNLRASRTPEVRAKIGAGHKGKVISDETRRKMSASQKAAWRRRKQESA